MEELKVQETPNEPELPKKLDPVAVEKAMLEAEAKKAEQVDPEEIASMMLTLYTPRFCALVDKLSNRQLRRLVKSLIEYPIGKQYNHNDSTEAEAFAIGNRLADAKYVLMVNTYNENREHIMEAAEKAAANVETTFGVDPEANDEGKENGKKEA